MTFDEQFDHGTEIELDQETRELLDPEAKRRRKFDALIKVIKDSGSFYMPDVHHECGSPACILGHCMTHFGQSLSEYLDIGRDKARWLISGHFSTKKEKDGGWRDITKDEAITALEMVRDYKVPDNPIDIGYTID